MEKIIDVNEIKSAKSEIIKMIKMFDKLIKETDDKFVTSSLTISEQYDQSVRIGWERGLTWALTVIELEERGELEIYIHGLNTGMKIR